MLLGLLRTVVRRVVPPRVEQRLRAWLFAARNAGFKPHVAEFERFGKTYRFYMGDRIGETWFRNGWDWIEITYLKEHLVRPGDVIVECGAHHGELTLFFGDWVGPTGEVIAIDAIPRNCEIVAENVRLNRLTNVVVENRAVGAAAGFTMITDESNALVAGEGGVGVRVPVVPIDAYASRKPTLLKIDVEGYEAEVLRGAVEVLRTRPRLAIEIHPSALPRFGATVADVLDQLAPFNYQMWYRARGESVVPYEGQPITEASHIFAIPA